MGRTLLIILLGIAFAGCAQKSKEYQALQDEYHWNEKLLRRYYEMKPVWKKRAENDEMPMQAYLDSLQAESRLIDRQDSIVYRLNALDGKAPEGREKRRR